MKGEPDDFKIGSDQEGEDVDRYGTLSSGGLILICIASSHLPKPKNVMQDGESFEVSSNTSTSTYTIKRCFGGVGIPNVLLAFAYSSPFRSTTALVQPGAIKIYP